MTMSRQKPQPIDRQALIQAKANLRAALKPDLEKVAKASADLLYIALGPESSAWLLDIIVDQAHKWAHAFNGTIPGAQQKEE